MKKQMFGIALIFSLLVGCVSQEHGTKLEADKVSQIKKGITTRAEVEALLGPPINVTIGGNGKRMMFYSYSVATAHPTAISFIPIPGVGGAEGQRRTQRLQIVLNSENVVEDYEFGDNTNELKGGGLFNSGVTSTPVSPASK